MPRNFIDQANYLRYEFIDAVDSLESWNLAGDMKKKRQQMLEDKRDSLAQEGLAPLQGHRPNSISTYIERELRLANVELKAHERHNNLFSEEPGKALERARKHFEENQEAYFDYAVYIGRILHGAETYVGGELQTVSKERINELEGRTEPNPYAQNLLLPPARCLDRPAGTPIY